MINTNISKSNFLSYDPLMCDCLVLKSDKEYEVNL